MLFVALIFLTVGYTMVYAALHGNWQFWTYFFPKSAATTALVTGPGQTVA